MDFARKQLEKYGWSNGKGLGKHENGISQPLKPKLKRSVAGVGYDAAADFTEHWWSTLYNKAANNVEVLEENGKTKKIKTKDTAEFVITNSTWRLNKKKKEENSEPQTYSDNFVRTAVLTSGGSKTEKVKDSESEEEGTNVVSKLTDEELFAACEGRTAHKGARHGLKALGKLARIEQQEQILLQQSKYCGYSHTKKHKKSNKESVVEEMNLNGNSDLKLKKKKKKKRCNSLENDDSIFGTVTTEGNIPDDLVHENIADCKNIKKKNNIDSVEQTDISNSNTDVPRKKKKKKCNTFENDSIIDNNIVDVSLNLDDGKIVDSKSTLNKDIAKSGNVGKIENNINYKNVKKRKIVNNNESVDIQVEVVVKKRKKKIKE